MKDNGVPDNWYAVDFDDSAWASATEYTASQARVLGLRVRVQDVGFRFWGVGLRVKGWSLQAY